MALSTAPSPNTRGGPSGLADVLDVLLDKGLVIDAFVRVSLVGIELLTVDARVVVASVDTYLRFAEAVNRLDLNETGGKGLPELASGMVEEAYETGARAKTKGAIDSVKEKVEATIDDARETVREILGADEVKRAS